MFIGIVVGGLFYANFSPMLTYLTIFTDITDGGMLAKLSDSGNVGILIFLVVLGIMVALMNKAGGSAAYGRWAVKAIKTRRGALLSTFLLGVLVFVDDYFNCWTQAGYGILLRIRRAFPERSLRISSMQQRLLSVSLLPFPPGLRQ